MGGFRGEVLSYLLRRFMELSGACYADRVYHRSMNAESSIRFHGYWVFCFWLLALLLHWYMH